MQQQLHCYAPDENVVAATKLPSPAALEVIILTTSSAASDENLRNCRFCAWAIWKHGHVESPHANVTYTMPFRSYCAVKSTKQGL